MRENLAVAVITHVSGNPLLIRNSLIGTNAVFSPFVIEQ